MPGFARAPLAHDPSSSPALARRACSFRPSLLAPALLLAVALGQPSCKGDPVRRITTDAGLALQADAGADGGVTAPGRSGSTTPEDELIPGLDGLGLDPEQLGPGLLGPGD